MPAKYLHVNFMSQNDYFLTQLRHNGTPPTPVHGTPPGTRTYIYTEIHRSGFSTVNHNYN